MNVNNPALLGWVFEMKVIKLIQKGREPFSIINSTDGPSVSWPTVYERAGEEDFDPPIYTDKYKSEITGLVRNMGKNITVVSNSEDLNSNDESVNLAVGGKVLNLPASTKKKNSEKKILVTSDYKIATRISVLNEAPLKAK